MRRRLGLILVCVVTLAAAGAAPASAATATTTAAGRVIPLAPAATTLRRQVLGFLPTSYVGWAATNLDYGALTTVAYFGIPASRDGHLTKRTPSGTTDHRWAVWNGSTMTRIINDAHARGVKVVLTVTGFAWTSGQRTAMTELLSSSSRRATLASEIAGAVAARGVDGVNLDFEPIPSGQKANFTALVRQVRAALAKRSARYELTFDITGYMDSYDVKGATATGAAHAVVIMGYHYRAGWSKTAGSTSPLTRPGYDITDTVNLTLTYTTPDKVILALPYYGYAWSTTSSAVHSSTRPGSSMYGYPSSVLYRNAVGIAAQRGRLWDSVEQGPWARWIYRACADCPTTWRQMYYDDVQSMGLKYDLVNREGLRGTGIWALGYQGSRTELNDLIRRKFGS